MSLFRIRHLLYSLALCAGCASDYKHLVRIAPDQSCIQKHQPPGLSTSWYNAAIDVVGHHISGLLLVKAMPDSSHRIVFTNEAGVTFLDFQFAADGTFRVHHVLDKLNKRAVINLLKNDFALLLGIPFKSKEWQAWRSGDELYYGVKQKKETGYFITDPDCSSLHRVESGSKRKRKLTIQFYGKDLQKPDSIHLQHHTFAMLINLRKLEKN